MTSKKPSKKNSKTLFKKIKTIEGMTEYDLVENGLKVIHYPILGTNVISSSILYFVGSRDEIPGETGLAHMLEHMLFKPTKEDRAKKQDSAAMEFERQYGVTLNANTWRERTCYFFSYPKEHVATAMGIEAARMQGVVLDDKEFLPERTNVLSEFDMYNGFPDFALENAIYTTALQSHPYRHEVIGFREDIEAYTSEKLECFYRRHYAPNNAVLMVIGDIDETTMKKEVYRAFSRLPKAELSPRTVIKEPKQEGKRYVTINRPSTTNMVAIAFKHEGFPSLNWTMTLLLTRILAGGPDSILHRHLVDTGKASELNFRIEPTREGNLAVLYITLSKGQDHAKIESEILKRLGDVSLAELKKELPKTVAQIVDSEPFERDSSLGIMHELTEYVAAYNWTAYFDTTKSVKSVTPTMLKKHLTDLLCPTAITTGYFIGTTE